MEAKAIRQSCMVVVDLEGPHLYLAVNFTTVD